MSSKTVFYVPLKPYVKQYFVKEFGAEPILVVSNNLLGQLIILSTEQRTVRFTQKKPTQRKEMLELRMPKRLQSLTMSDAQREGLTKVLEKLFYEKLYSFIRSQAAITGSEWAALRCFAEIYELDSESFDMDKAYKLWRDRKNTVVFSNQEAIAKWYQNNRVHSDLDNEHVHATVTTH